MVQIFVIAVVERRKLAMAIVYSNSTGIKKQYCKLHYIIDKSFIKDILKLNNAL